MNDFKNELEKINIKVDKKTEEKFELYYQILIEENEKYNLTAITEKEEVYTRHFYDSLLIAKDIDLKNKSILDVGSGAGFPSVPLKICFPDLEVVIVESLGKRVKFLNNLVEKLNLKNVTIIYSRIEDYDNKNYFDYVTARAVARLNILSEFCIPFVKKNGYFLAYKGKDYLIELNEAKNALNKLNSKYIKSLDYIINDKESHVLVINKTEKTDEMYPRNFAKIKKNPL